MSVKKELRIYKNGSQIMHARLLMGSTVLSVKILVTEERIKYLK